MTGATDFIVASVPDATRTPGPQTAANESASNEFWGDDGFTFDDFLDLINPLQHLPIVSTIYRAATGDTISTGARVFGGALFGGVFGVFAAVFNAIVDQATGKDLGEHVLALFDGSDTAPNQASPTAFAASTPTEPLAVTPQAQPPWLSRMPQAPANFAAAPAGAATDRVLDRLGQALDKYEIMRATRAAYEVRQPTHGQGQPSVPDAPREREKQPFGRRSEATGGVARPL